MKIFYFLIAIIIFCISSAVSADTEEDGRIWLNVNAQGDLPLTSFKWYIEVQPRWREEGEALDALLIRPAIFYKLNDSSSIWLGYANVKTHPAGKSDITEHRLWQQYLHNFEPIHGVKLQSRTRFEQRRFENYNDTEYKIRQLIRATKPLENTSSLYLAAWDEYFLSLSDTDWGARSGFDQNRLFLGLGYTLNSTLSFEVGYLNQYVNAKSVDVMNHVLSTTLNFNF